MAFGKLFKKRDQLFHRSLKCQEKRWVRETNCGKQWTGRGISLCWSPIMCLNSFYILHWTSVVACLAHLVSGPQPTAVGMGIWPRLGSWEHWHLTVMSQEEISDSNRGHERSNRTIAGMLGNRAVSVCSSSGYRYLVQRKPGGRLATFSCTACALSTFLWPAWFVPQWKKCLRIKPTQRKGKIDKFTFLKILFQPQLKPSELLKCLSYLSLDIGL